MYSISFEIFHVFFWKLFNWKTELAKLNFANKAIVQILNCRIIYLFLFVGFICFFYPDELLGTGLGKTFLGGMSLFWLGRTVEQFVFFRRRNKYVNMLTAVFIIGTILFALPVLNK